jgi:BNR repeat protein
MRAGPVFISTLILSSILVIVGSTNNSYAEMPERDPMVDVPFNALASSVDAGAPDQGKIFASSGSNIFVVWTDSTPGNADIFFKRSTDSGATWKATANLSNNAGDSINPQIAVSGSDVFVVWRQRTVDGDVSNVYFRRSLDDGAGWGPKVKISSSGAASSALPQVAASGSNVYVTWEDGSSLAEVLFRRSTDNGGTWKSIVNLSHNAGDSTDPQIQVSGSNLYVAWGDLTPGNPEVFLRRSTDNGVTWKAVKNLSNNSADSYGPQVAVSGSNIYVAWYDYSPGPSDIFFKRSTDNGVTWKAVKNLSNNAGNSYSQQLAVDGANVYVVWQDNTPGPDDIFFNRSTDNGAMWMSGVNLSNNVAESANPQIAVESGNVYVVWQDNTPGDNDIFFQRSTDNGAMWETAINLSNNAGDSANPQIAVYGTKVYVVWNDISPGNYDIFIRRSLDDGVTWKPFKNLSNNLGFSFLPQIAP